VEHLLADIRRILEVQSASADGMQAVVSLLRGRVEHYNWVGIYLVQNGKLLLGPWDGPEATEHTEIDLGAGICGLAAGMKETVIVDDVNSRPEYLACFISTKSEIVVPLMRGEECVGEIDIDSDKTAAFTMKDRAFLEQAAVLLVEAYFDD
jgi:L-methionine (R)-S-oxide reductase